MQKNHAIIAGIAVVIGMIAGIVYGVRAGNAVIPVVAFLAGAVLLLLIRRNIGTVIEDEWTLLVEQKAATLHLRVHLRSRAEELFRRLGVAIDPGAICRNLTVPSLSRPFRMSLSTLRYWLEHGVVHGRLAANSDVRDEAKWPEDGGHPAGVCHPHRNGIDPVAGLVP